MCNLRTTLLIFFTMSLLVSCASWKKYEYSSSKAWQIGQVRPIVIPPGFDSSDIEEYYSIPYLGDSPSTVIDINQPPVKHVYKPPTKPAYKPTHKRLHKPAVKPASQTIKKHTPRSAKQPVRRHPVKEYYPIPDIVHENMKRSELGEVPKGL